MRFWIPAVEAADDGDGASVGGPYAENRAGLPVVRSEMGAHLVVNAVVAAFVEKEEVLVAEKLGGGSGFGAHALRGFARRFLVYWKMNSVAAIAALGCLGRVSKALPDTPGRRIPQAVLHTWTYCWRRA